MTSSSSYSSWAPTEEIRSRSLLPLYLNRLPSNKCFLCPFSFIFASFLPKPQHSTFKPTHALRTLPPEAVKSRPSVTASSQMQLWLAEAGRTYGPLPSPAGTKMAQVQGYRGVGRQASLISTTPCSPQGLDTKCDWHFRVGHLSHFPEEGLL